ncbi:MAG: hypothetical protein CMH56_06205 [Myxococcales bacterium]|nr:hypothetical protein [Myxococcales bacterium]|tara:strand:+ start:2015 stop:3160 length:1146 start_codon:yes stop_codon:yes gene_type:complete
MKRAAFFFISAIGLIPQPGQAQDTQVDSYGYAETTVMSFVAEEDAWAYMHARYRPTFEATLNDRLVLSSSFSLTGRHHTSQDFFWTDCAPDQTCFFPSRFGHENGLFELERFFLDYYGEQTDIRVGRQALFWGSGLLWNPTNPFRQLLAFSPWENRSGIDAVRVNWAWPWEVDSTWILSLDQDGNLAKGVVRLQKQFVDLDVALMGALSTLENKEGSYVGFDLKGNLGLTYWVEGAVHLEPEEYNELVVGIDYSFDVLDTWVLALQYSYNEAADLDPMALYLTDPFMPLATDKNSWVLSSGLNFMEDWSLQSLLYTSVDNEAGVAMNTLSWAGADAFSAQMAWIQPYTFGDKEEAALPGGGAALETADLSAFVMLWGRWNY